jgi:hypothetical protein
MDNATDVGMAAIALRAMMRKPHRNADLNTFERPLI